MARGSEAGDSGFLWARFRASRLESSALVCELQCGHKPGQALLRRTALERPAAQGLGVLVAAPGARYCIRFKRLHGSIHELRLQPLDVGEILCAACRGFHADQVLDRRDSDLVPCNVHYRRRCPQVLERHR